MSDMRHRVAFARHLKHGVHLLAGPTCHIPGRSFSKAGSAPSEPPHSPSLPASDAGAITDTRTDTGTNTGTDIGVGPGTGSGTGTRTDTGTADEGTWAPTCTKQAASDSAVGGTGNGQADARLPNESPDCTKLVLFKGGYMKTFRMLVRFKIFQLVGIAALAIPINTFLVEVRLLFA